MSTIKIFLASSEELEKDRKDFQRFIAEENDVFQHNGIYYQLIIWENFIDAMSKTRLQEEYNKAIDECDIFIMLFWTKVGRYTAEEFEKAFKQFQKTNKPLIYTYFKNAPVLSGNLNKKDNDSLFSFQEKLIELNHFQTKYETPEGLALHFKKQLDKMKAGKSLPKATVAPIPHCLSAGQPSVTTDFIGRDIELNDIKTKLEKHGLLLINGEGGMGKTSIVSKYLKDKTGNYKHYAWLFCNNGITENLKNLAPALGIDLTTIRQEDQLLAIKTEMENLQKKCLLILDNANTPEHIKEFENHFGGIHWDTLITSRCKDILPKEKEYTLEHLKPENAKELFKKYYSEETPDFEIILDKLLLGIGYNTLLIEVFSKNLKELSALGETLADFVKQFEEKGLFLGDRSFEINTQYGTNIHKEVATTDQILEILYDVTTLKENERHLLVNLAVLPAESHPLILLLDAFVPKNNIEFIKQLKSLVQKGWLNTDIKTYRINPVVQKIILNKNRESLWQDTQNLVHILNYKLKSDGNFLVNLTYNQAQPFIEFAKSAISFIKKESFEVALLLGYIADYYNGIGNFSLSLFYNEKASIIYKVVDIKNYAVCLRRIGGIYLVQRNFKKALDFFEQNFQLIKDLSKAAPLNKALKNMLSISYEKMGNVYQNQGNIEKALEFFEEGLKLAKKNFKDDPLNEYTKESLSVFYQKMGTIYERQNNLQKALQFLKLSLKLGQELFNTNQKNESLKNSVAIFNERVGSVYQKKGDLKKALKFLETGIQLTEELFNANPQSITIYNGLAISYSKLGGLYIEMQRAVDAKPYLEKAEKIWVDLCEKADTPQYQSNLDWVRKQLKELDGK